MTNELVDTGASFSGLERDHLFLNSQGKTFTEKSGLSGLDSLGDARTHARLDMNRDGYPDIALVNANAPFLQLYENRLATTSKNQFLALRLHGGNRSSGNSEWSARDAIGAQVRVHVDGRILLRELRAGEGFAGQNSKTLLIGLGKSRQVDFIEIRWPSGKVLRTSQLPASRLIDVFENPDDAPAKESVQVSRYQGRSVAPLAENKTVDRLPLEVSENASLSIYVTMATWCQTCERELARLPQMISNLPQGAVAAFGVPIDPDDTRQEIRRWQVGRDESVPLLENLTDEQRERIRVILRQRATSPESVPNTIVADPQGNIRAVFPGTPTLSQIRALLDS